MKLYMLLGIRAHFSVKIGERKKYSESLKARKKSQILADWHFKVIFRFECEHFCRDMWTPSSCECDWFINKLKQSHERERDKFYRCTGNFRKSKLLTMLHAFAIFILCLSSDVNLSYVSFTYLIRVCPWRKNDVYYILPSYLRQTLYTYGI